MDFNWFPYMHGFWLFPLLCLLFMAVMMFACGRMWFRFGHGGRARHDGGETPRSILERRYASGQIGKEEYEAVRRDLEG